MSLRCFLLESVKILPFLADQELFPGIFSKDIVPLIDSLPLDARFYAGGASIRGLAAQNLYDFSRLHNILLS